MRSSACHMPCFFRLGPPGHPGGPLWACPRGRGAPSPPRGAALASLRLSVEPAGSREHHTPAPSPAFAPASPSASAPAAPAAAPPATSNLIPRAATTLHHYQPSHGHLPPPPHAPTAR